jgi:hypothetical protein
MSLQQNLLEALQNALVMQNKQQREHGEKQLNDALEQNAAEVLPTLIQIAGNSSFGPSSELAAIRSKNYLLHYTGSPEIWDERIVPPTRLAVFNQLPTATPTARRVLLASLRILLQNNPWPELIEMAAPVLNSAAEQFRQSEGKNEGAFNTVICALEAILVSIADYRVFGLVEKDIQDHAARILLPILPPLFSLQRTEIVSLVFAVFHSLVSTNRPRSLDDETLRNWIREMLSFPEKFTAASSHSKKAFEHYIKAVNTIAMIAIQIVDVTGASPPQGGNNNNNSSKNKGGKNSKSNKKKYVRETPVVYGFCEDFTKFFANFLNYVASFTMKSAESSDILPSMQSAS